jgi:hypothetical protein
MISMKPDFANAHFSIRDKIDPDSNITEESDQHSKKQPSLKTSTNEGTMISIRPVSANANFSIRDKIDPDSTVTEESDLHGKKQPSPKTSTDKGRMISIRPSHRTQLHP